MDTTTKNYSLIPRSVYFKDGKAVHTHPSISYDKIDVIRLPTDHYDFIGPIPIVGKTKDQIESDIKVFCEKHKIS